MLPPPGEDNRVKELTRRVENLESALRAAFTTISGGRGLVVNGGGGITIADGGQLRVQYPAEEGGGVGVYFGDINAVGTGDYQGTGLLIQDPDGTDIATFRSDAATGNPVVVLRDAQENAVLYTDTTTGQGLGRPYVPGVFYPSRNTDWISTTSTAWATLLRAKMPKQHASLYVRAWAQNDTGGATGEVRVLVNEDQLGSVQPVGFAIAERSFYGSVTGEHMADLHVEIQARVVSGGAVRIGPSSLDGRV